MPKNLIIWVTIFLIVLVLAAGGFVIYQYYVSYNALYNENLALKDNISGLHKTLDNANNVNSQLLTKISSQEQTVTDYQNSLGKIESTVQTLNKWQALDPELLEKYSKVFFLSENYVPKALINIDTKYLYDKNKPLLIQDDVWPFLRGLLQSAEGSGNSLQIISAFRSFGMQESLKTSYKVTYGTGANAFSADQGYSEHQLGTTIDFTTPVLGVNFSGFDKAGAYNWLVQNAYKYGFEQSYPKGNTYYQYEPWHWRFVGIELATKLRNENKNFYDLPQRDIDTYLINIFNQT